MSPSTPPTCNHDRGRGTTVCLRCRHEQAQASAKSRQRFLMQFLGFASVAAVLVVAGVSAASTLKNGKTSETTSEGTVVPEPKAAGPTKTAAKSATPKPIAPGARPAGIQRAHGERHRRRLCGRGLTRGEDAGRQLQAGLRRCGLRRNDRDERAKREKRNGFHMEKTTTKPARRFLDPARGTDFPTPGRVKKRWRGYCTSMVCEQLEAGGRYVVVAAATTSAAIHA